MAGLHDSPASMSWSGQAHVMNNMYGSSYGVAGANMASSAALGHSGAFFRYMHRPHHPHHSVPGEILQFMCHPNARDHCTD